MSLRFSNLEAIKAALGNGVRIRDSFLVNERSAGAEDCCWRRSGKPAVSRSCRLLTRQASGPSPHDMLWGVVSAVFDGAVREFENAVPGRRYRLDIALPAARLAIEVDGWEWHGKHKGDFIRDRERQNLLTLNGWRILRFTAGQIRRDTQGCVEMIGRAIDGVIRKPKK